MLRLVDIFHLAVKLLNRQAKDYPNKTFTSAEGERVTIKDVADRLEILAKWVYPELSADDIELVVHCRNCRYYKRFKKKGDLLKARAFFACTKDMSRRDPGFFCKDGDRKE